MPAVKSRPRRTRDSITYIPLDDISPSQVQPRRSFGAEALRELAESIAEFGVLNPLTVRPRGERFELVAGERRLRAARIAGLYEVPCIVLDVDIEESGLIAMVENLQRRDLDFVEEAEGLDRLIRLFGLSQEECARRIGKSQSAVANKLRLLKLPPDVLDRLREDELTERHGRALLRLRDADAQRSALNHIRSEKLTVAETESYVERLLAGTERTPVRARRTLFVLKDVRIFLNTLNHGLELMKKGGIEAGLEKRETEDKLILTVSIPKNAPKKNKDEN
jgi:ParB family chromosome partitioning protein